MNKLFAFPIALVFFLATSSASASSTINLSIPSNNVIAANAEMELSLNTLSSEVPYIVTCVLDSTSPASLDMKFSHHLAAKGGYGVAKLNSKPILQDIGTLQNGANTFSFMASVASNKTAATNALIFKNLDNHFSASVKSCHAQPASKVTTAATRMLGGYFYVTNHLPYFVDITVGNYIPTSYCIGPYLKYYIETSSGYQNIDIVATHY